MDFLSYATVILKNQLKIIEVFVWNWRDLDLEKQMCEEGGVNFPDDMLPPGIIHYKINGYQEGDFFLYEIQNWQDSFFNEVDLNLTMAENESELRKYLKRLQKDFIEIKNDFSQKEKKVGKRIFPYFTYANAEIRIDTRKLIDEEVKAEENSTNEEVDDKENLTYEEIEAKENLTDHEWDILESCSSIFHRLKKINIDIINKLKLRLNKIEGQIKKATIEKTKIEPRFIWNKYDTDLLELIIALIESGAIQNDSKTLTTKEAIKTFSEIFNKEIKDPYKKLNAARNRKKEEITPFLMKLQETLEEYYKKQDEKDR